MNEIKLLSILTRNSSINVTAKRLKIVIALLITIVIIVCVNILLDKFVAFTLSMVAIEIILIVLVGVFVKKAEKEKEIMRSHENEQGFLKELKIKIQENRYNKGTKTKIIAVKKLIVEMIMGFIMLLVFDGIFRSKGVESRVVFCAAIIVALFLIIYLERLYKNFIERVGVEFHLFMRENDQLINDVLIEINMSEDEYWELALI